MSGRPYLVSSVRGRKVYFPAIARARVVCQYSVDQYRAILVTDCESVGAIRYSFALYFRKQPEAEPLLAMASELADINPDIGERCLGMFFQGSHYNYGLSSDWLDIEKFTARAMAIALEQLSISAVVEELPVETESGFNLPFLGHVS